MTAPRVFEKQLFAGWGDMDFNSHMRNTAFLDKSADVRMIFFAEHGFPTAEFMRRSLGPVILKDELEYFKEVRLLEPLRVTLAVAALAEDGSRFTLRNEFWKPDGKLAARVNSYAGWLDLSARRLTLPPETLLAALRSLPPTDDFQVLPSSSRSKTDQRAGG
jgi:acyl-CoA thioester hydrolase